VSLEPPRDLPKLDDGIVRQPEDIRRDVAEAASRNLFVFARGVLGYTDLTEGCHAQLCTWLDHNPSRFKLVLHPRDTFKTTINISRVMQKICQNPEHRILLANETATNAQRFLSIIRTHAESNKRFRALYPHLIPSDPKRWSQEELLFNRRGVYAEPTVDSIGMTGAMTSRHYTHMTFDDLISEEAAKSKLVMDDTITRFSKLYSLMVRPGEDTFDLVGTRWAFYDIYAYAMQRFGKDIARYIRGAIEDGKPIFPERLSLEVLADIRDDPVLGGEYNFSCQYMNNPRNVQIQDFNVQDLKFWRWSPDEESVVLYSRSGEIERVVEISDLDVTTTVDVRYGEKISSDRDAVVTVGTTETGDAIVLDAWGVRANPLEVVAKLIQVIKRYHPRCIGIQKVGYEMSLKYHLQAECERQGEYAYVVPVKPGGPTKSHIRGLQPVAATGHLYILPTQHVLRTELSEYPLGRNDDVADALALQLQLWRGLLSPERMLKYKQSEARLLRKIGNSRASQIEGIEEMTPSELEDAGYDPEMGRYGEFQSEEIRTPHQYLTR
jgi:hypothetical protein